MSNVDKSIVEQSNLKKNNNIKNELKQIKAKWATMQKENKVG